MAILTSGSWTFQQECQVAVEKRWKYVELAPEMKALHDAGVAYETIGSKYGMPRGTVEKIVKYAETGIRPEWSQAKAGTTGPRGPRKRPAGEEPKYRRYAHVVAKLRDEDLMPFPQICAYLSKKYGESISIGTVKRAYDLSHPAVIETAIATGTNPKRGAYCFLGAEKHAQIRELLLADWAPKAIAAAVGCGVMTVKRRVRQLR